MNKILLLVVSACLLLCPLSASAQGNAPSRAEVLVMKDNLLVLWSMGLMKSTPKSQEALCRDALFFLILAEGSACGVDRHMAPDHFQGIAENYEGFVPKQKVEEAARTIFGQEVTQHVASRGTHFDGNGYFLDFSVLSDKTGNPYAPDALKRYHSIVDLMFFKRIPERGPNGVIDRWNWQKNEILGPLAQTYQGTLTGRLIGDFIAAVDANGQKDPQGLKQRFAALIDAELAPKKGADAATAPAAKVWYYEGKGVINNKIPVALWFDSREGIVSGEIVYTATKARKPIRILGREEADGAFRLYEMLPNGDISGTISGTLTDGVLSGTWTGRPRKIEKSEGNYEAQRGRQFPITISAVKRTHPPYDWTFDAANASGTYAYSLGDNCDDGTVVLQVGTDGTVRYRIIGLTGAPFYRTASFPEDALSDETAVAHVHGNRILIEEDANCAIELVLYNDFLVSSYVDGKNCRYRVGDGATAEGLFLKRR